MSGICGLERVVGAIQICMKFRYTGKYGALGESLCCEQVYIILYKRGYSKIVQHEEKKE